MEQQYAEFVTSAADFHTVLIYSVTGFNMKPKESAKMVLEAVQNFASKSPQYLKQIDFIIYQDSMMKEFKKALTSFRSSNSSAGKPQSMLQAAWKHVKGIVHMSLVIFLRQIKNADEEA